MAMRFLTRIDNFEDLSVEFIEDGLKKSIIEHEFSGVDGALLEDMGAAAEKFRISIAFFRTQLDRYPLFDKHIRVNRIVTFVHPERGPIRGRVSETKRRLIDKKGMMVELTITEQKIEISVPKVATDLIPQVESMFVDGQSAQIANFEIAARAAIGADAADVLAVAVPAEGSIISSFPSATSGVRNWLVSIDQKLTRFDAWLSDVTMSSDTPTQDFDYGSTLAGRVVGSLARLCERQAASAATYRTFPQRWIDAFSNSFTTLKFSAGNLLSQLSAGIALVGNVHLAQIYKEDQTERDLARSMELRESFDLNGRYLGARAYPDYASVDALEASLYIARVNTQIAVDAIRLENGNPDYLKKMVSVLTDYLTTIKIERERLTSITPDNWIPLHLLLLQRGLPYGYAERLMKINTIENPTFTDSEIKIYA